MGRYFGREPRYTREEIERQAQAAIDARVAMGRPPAEDFLPLEQRLAEIDRALAARPPVEPIPEAQPMQIRTVRVPAGAAAPAPGPAPAPKPSRTKAGRGEPVAARSRAN